MPRPARGRSTCWPSWRATRIRPAISSSRARTYPELNSAITGLAIVSDTTVAPIETVHGKVAFLQLVGLTQPELDALARDPDALDGILERMRADDPELVLDMRRTKSYV